MTLFQMNDQEIVAAETLDQACEWYQREFGLSVDEAFPDGPPFQMSEAAIDEETRIKTDDPSLPKIPAREAMAADLARGCKPPYLFSTTEW